MSDSFEVLGINCWPSGGRFLRCKLVMIPEDFRDSMPELDVHTSFVEKSLHGDAKPVVKKARRLLHREG